MTAGMRRSKAMPTDGPTAKFLYSIIKQLDLKSIDWTQVANSLEISNGHAARMRFSRFRQQMEGTTSTPRGSRPRKNAKSDKGGNSKAGMKRDPASPMPVMKQENGVMVKQENGMMVKQEHGHGMMVKQENGFYPSHQTPMYKHDPYSQDIPNLADIPPAPQPMVSTQSVPPSMMPYPPMTMGHADFSMQSSLSPFSSPSHPGFERQFERPRNPHHVWTPVKMEQEDATGTNDVLVKVERPESR